MPTAISVLKYAGLLGLIINLSACQGLEGVQVQGVDLGKLASAGQHLTNMGQKSVDEERVIGQNTATILLSKAAVLNNPPLQTYVNRVGLWVAQHSERPDLPWRFVVLDSPQVAAYAAPGGYVFITSGMLTRMNSEAELAGVLAHEVAHVVQKHHLQAIQQQAQTGLLTTLPLLLMVERVGGAGRRRSSVMREVLGWFTRSTTCEPVRQIENTVPLSTPFWWPAEIAMTSRGPPVTSMSATPITRASAASASALGGCGKNCRS